MLLSNIGKKKNGKSKKRLGNEAKWRKFFSVNNEYLAQYLMDAYCRRVRNIIFITQYFKIIGLARITSIPEH